MEDDQYTWQNEIYTAQLVVRESNVENRFISFSEAIDELCRICKFPIGFEKAMKDLMTTVKSGLRLKFAPVWQGFLEIPEIEKEHDQMRYHFIIPALINMFNDGIGKKPRESILGPDRYRDD